MGYQRDNEELTQLARADQREREHFFENPDQVTCYDAKRRAQVLLFEKKDRLRTAKDYFHAALIFQHGLTAEDYEKAAHFALVAFKKGYGVWAGRMYAFAVDRKRVSGGHKQKFGTQFDVETRTNKRGKTEQILHIKPWDKRTSDKTRATYGIAPIAQLLQKDGSKIRVQKPIPLKR